MPLFPHDGLMFHYRDEGSGLPFVFQHGLGGDTNQPFGVYRPNRGVRMIVLDSRAHGLTRPVGDTSKISLETFADDLLSLLDRLGVARAVLGGISMGAAVSLLATLKRPDRVQGLVLSRPAWVDRPLPPNLRVFESISRLLLEKGAREGLPLFLETPEYQAIKEESPDCANALVGQFTHPRAEECVARLERIPHDAPCHQREALHAIGVPTLILGNRMDPVHPWWVALELAEAIPGAELWELTPKSVSVERHAVDVQRAIDDFLNRHFLGIEAPAPRRIR